MNMGATCSASPVASALAGVTREGARALGRLDEFGTLEAGKRMRHGDLGCRNAGGARVRLGFNPLHARIWSGE
jgi:imidazolonepropionase